jgi:hypothetical protein
MSLCVQRMLPEVSSTWITEYTFMLLNISNEQMSYITNAKEGSGLIRIGSAVVPFINEFSKNTELCKLMTTKKQAEGLTLSACYITY